jgi:hypothetical protein
MAPVDGPTPVSGGHVEVDRVTSGCVVVVTPDGALGAAAVGSGATTTGTATSDASHARSTADAPLDIARESPPGSVRGPVAPKPPMSMKSPLFLPEKILGVCRSEDAFTGESSGGSWLVEDALEWSTLSSRSNLNCKVILAARKSQHRGVPLH